MPYKNKVKKREWSKEYYKENKEIILKKVKEYRKNNKDNISKQRKEHYQNNKER